MLTAACMPLMFPLNQEEAYEVASTYMHKVLSCVPYEDRIYVRGEGIEGRRIIVRVEYSTGEQFTYSSAEALKHIEDTIFKGW